MDRLLARARRRCSACAPVRGTRSDATISISLGTAGYGMETPEASHVVPSPYDGVESLEHFASAEALERYRAGLLAKSESELSFIRREVGSGPLRVLDLGTGSGRVLVALALHGMARSGTGVDIAPSRVAFARQWADHLGIDVLDFVAADVLRADEWLEGEFDLILGIANLLGFLRVAQAEAASEVVRLLYRHLSPRGCMLLEFYQLNRARRTILALSGDRLRTWMPLPTWDRFAYYLSDFAYDPATGLMDHVKTFIGRDGSIDAGRRERTGFYTRGEVIDILEGEGCSAHRAYRDYEGSAFSDEHSSQVILLAGGREWTSPEREPAGASPADARPDGPGAWVV